MPEVTQARKQAGWTTVSLGDVVDVINDYWDRDTTTPERLVAGEHIDEGELRVRRWGMTDDDLIPPTFNRRFQQNDALLHSRNIDKVAKPEFGGITGEKVFILRSKDEAILLQDLVPYLVASDHFRHYAESRWAGSTNKFLNKTPLMAYEFALPPLEEQRRIAKVLQAAQGSKLASGTLVQSAERLLLATYKEVFQDAEQSPRSLSDIADVRMGRQRSPAHQNGDHMLPYLRAANIKDGSLDLSSVLEMNFDPREQEIFALAPGDVLVTEGCGSLSQIGANSAWESELPGTVCFQNTVIRLRAIPGKIEPDLLKHWAKYAFRAGIFAAASRGTNVFHVGSTRCAQIPVQIPDISRQRRVCERLSVLQLALGGCKERFRLAALISDGALSLVLGDSA